MNEVICHKEKYFHRKINRRRHFDSCETMSSSHYVGHFTSVHLARKKKWICTRVGEILWPGVKLREHKSKSSEKKNYNEKQLPQCP